MLRQNRIALGPRKPDMIFLLQAMRELLPTAVIRACTQLPPQALERGQDLVGSLGTMLGLRMTLQIA